MTALTYAPTTGVVVTGGASGIGRATAHALAAAGRGVAVWDRDGAAAQVVADALHSEHSVASHAIGIDVRATAAFPDAIAASRAAIGPIGGLVHSAGVPGVVAPDDLDEENWDAVVDVNLRAHALLVRALLPELRAAMPGSAIVAIASIEGIVANARVPAYCASKAGLLGLTRSLALSLASEGIRANAVCPGFIDTPIHGAALSTPEAQASVNARIPMGRMGRPEDIAGAVRFLLSSDAAYITGTELVVDGGTVVSPG